MKLFAVSIAGGLLLLLISASSGSQNVQQQITLVEYIEQLRSCADDADLFCSLDFEMCCTFRGITVSSSGEVSIYSCTVPCGLLLYNSI